MSEYPSQHEPLNPAPPFYRFLYAGSDISVSVHFNIPETLATTLPANSDSSSPVALLLGTVDANHKAYVIESIKVVKIRGEADLLDAVSRWRPGPERRIHALGYARSCQSRHCAVSAHDSASVQAAFDGSALVWVTQPATGGVLWNFRPGQLPISAELTAKIRRAVPIEHTHVTRLHSGPDIRYVMPLQAGKRSAVFSWRWFWISLLGVAGAAGVWSAYPRTGKASLGMSKKVRPASPLGLDLKTAGGTLQLTWNNSVPAIASASGAVLTVTENGVSSARPLDRAALQSGSLMCCVSGSDVRLQMEVYGPQMSSVTDSLWLLKRPALTTMCVGPAR